MNREQIKAMKELNGPLAERFPQNIPAFVESMRKINEAPDDLARLSSFDLRARLMAKLAKP